MGVWHWLTAVVPFLRHREPIVNHQREERVQETADRANRAAADAERTSRLTHDLNELRAGRGRGW